MRLHHDPARPLVVPIALVFDPALTDADVRLWMRAAVAAEQGRDVPVPDLGDFPESAARLAARSFLSYDVNEDVWEVLDGPEAAR